MLYIIIKCVTFEDVDITNDYLIALSKIASEVLIAFISIDSFIMTFYSKTIKNNDESIKILGIELENEYADRFDLFFKNEGE